MKKLLLMLSTALMFAFTGCTQFDDTRIWDAIDELEDLFDDLDNRVEDLEEACEKMNTNIEALQTLVAALQANDTITSIAPIKQGDKIIGYTISFSKSEPITIYHGNDGKDGADGEDGKDGENGADGEDGYTPQIGIAKDSDNVYYWTLDGEWLLDENGNKIKAVGTDGKDGEDGEDGANGNDGSNGENGENGADGKDGITPQLEIRDGYWYISYDNGATWKELGKATGEDGKDGADGEDGKDGEDGTNGTDGQDGKDGDSLFQSVTWDEVYAYFTLSDGTVIKIPLASDSEAEEGDLPPANEIWYTSTDGEVVTPYATDFFGANIVSNTYKNGKGVITFDGEVTSIQFRAFCYCSSLISVTIPDSVTSIGDMAFDNCSSLASVTIPDSVTRIGNYAFDSCSSLTSINIPDSVTSIGDSAFEYCHSLISVTIPDSVTWIGDQVFYYCTSLTSVTIPDSVTWIGYRAFSYCTSLKSIYGKYASEDGRCLIIDGTLNFFAPAGLTEYTIPDSVTSIRNSAFSDCTSLTSITIPDSVTSIFGSAFYECYSLTSVYCKATTPPAGNSDMFSYNASERTIYVPTESVDAYKAAEYWCDYADYIVGYEFENGGSGEDITTPPANEIWYTSTDGEVVTPFWEIDEEGNSVFNANIISNTYENGKGVITFDSDVTSFGYGAFAMRTNLKSIIIPNSVTVIGDSAFASCKSLASVSIGYGVTSIGYKAFHCCESLASVTIPDSVTEIGNNAFYCCENLASVTIPDSVTSIGDYAFDSCSLASVSIGNGVTSIGEGAFAYCSSLASVTIPDSVTSIGYCAFAYCWSLASVTIPDSVTEIGEGAFCNCLSLASVYCKATTPPSLGVEAFYNNASERKIYVPTESVDAYKAADYWSEYAGSIVGYDFE